VAPGAAVTGCLHLPDGPLAFWGEVRRATPHVAGSTGAADVINAAGPCSIGCSVSLAGPDRVRLEQFLFGSDLQWHLNGLSDRVHTPLSRLLPCWVDGPRPHALSGRHWTAVELRQAIYLPPMQALMRAPETGDARPAYLVSHSRLPTGVPLLLDQFRRKHADRCGVVLQPAEHAGVGFHVYQAQPSALPATAALPMAAPADAASSAASAAPTQTPAAREADELIHRACRSPGEPSTLDVHPMTM
jgi:hypothetical protein